jgi:glycosyltransferase involved in cell wall biosynthesis
MQRHSHNLVKFLAKNDVEITLGFTVNENETVPSEKEVLDALEIDSSSNFSFHVFQFQPKTKLPGHYVRGSKEMSAKIYEHYKDQLNDYDAIYCKGLMTWEFAAKRQSGILKVPLITNFHGYEMFQEAPNLKIKLQHILLLRKVTRQIMDRSDYVVSYGAKITDLLKSLGFDKIIEVPSGVTDDWIVEDIEAYREGKIKVVFLGRYERRKGVQEIHQVIDEHRDELAKKFEFHFIGPIPEEVRVSGDHVTYHGETRDGAKIKSLMSEMDVLLCPSYSEGMPNVILEAMSRGLAVIATNVGAVSLMVGSDNGKLIADPRPETIRKALNEIGSSDINTLKQESLKKIERFRWSNIAIETLEKLKKTSSEVV